MHAEVVADVSMHAFDPELLLAAIQRKRSPGQLCCGRLLLDPISRQGFVAGVDLGLSDAEFAVTAQLVRCRGIPMSKHALLAALPPQTDTRMVDVFVNRARAKLAAAGLDGLITTCWGRGYMVYADDDAGPASQPTACDLVPA